MRKRIFGLLVVLVVSVWAYAPANAWPFFQFHTTYYSDYFATEIGWEHSWCDLSYDSGGAQAGEYVLNERWSCSTGAYAKRCYHVVNGDSTEIACP